jgi:hypothetical protein
MKEIPNPHERSDVPAFPLDTTAFNTVQSASEATPAQSEITAPSGGAPEAWEEPTEQSDVEQVRHFFDETRIDWDWGRKYAGHDRTDLGYDPKHIKYIVRRDEKIADADQPPAELFREHERYRQSSRNSKAEIQRLTQGTELKIPEYFDVLPPYPTPDTYGVPTYTAYTYVQRLKGEPLNIDNPEHLSHAMQLGKAVTKYLAETPVNGKYAAEYTYPEQWTVGRPLFERRTPTGLYLHDITSVDRLDIRPPTDPNTSMSPDYDDFEDVELYKHTIDTALTWISNLPASAERNEQLRILESLQLPEGY